MSKKIKKKKSKSIIDKKYAMKVAFLVFFISMLLSFLSNQALNDINVYFSILVLLLFVVVGVVFDTIGIAVATADEKPFHSMSAKNIKSATMAVKMIKNAEKVSNVCNDVVGDIAGIISGSACAVISIRLTANMQDNTLKIAVSLLFAGCVASLTVALKAFGKAIAINHSNYILDLCSKAISVFAFGHSKNKK